MIIFKQVISLMNIQHFSTAMTIKYPRKIYGNPATDFDRKIKTMETVFSEGVIYKITGSVMHNIISS